MSMLFLYINENKIDKQNIFSQINIHSCNQISTMGKKGKKNNIVGNLNFKEKITESDLQTMSRKELIELASRLLTKSNRIENRLDKLESAFANMQQDFKKQDEAVEDTKKTAKIILKLLDNKEIKEKKSDSNQKSLAKALPFKSDEDLISFLSNKENERNLEEHIKLKLPGEKMIKKDFYTIIDKNYAKEKVWSLKNQPKNCPYKSIPPIFTEFYTNIALQDDKIKHNEGRIRIALRRKCTDLRGKNKEEEENFDEENELRMEENEELMENDNDENIEEKLTFPVEEANYFDMSRNQTETNEGENLLNFEDVSLNENNEGFVTLENFDVFY